MKLKKKKIEGVSKYYLIKNGNWYFFNAFLQTLGYYLAKATKEKLNEKKKSSFWLKQIFTLK